MNRIHLIVAILALAAPALSSAGDFPKGSPAFVHSYSDAVSAAKSSGKPAIIVFSAAWCGPCQVMKKEVYPSASVKPFHDKFVWAYLDVDEASNEKAAAKFGVNGIPHIQFVNGEGKAIDKQIGATSPDAFAKTLAAVLKKAGAK
ncbi:MAG: thioredoxin family protein [Verrucomicrobiaceae bacterium]|nr:thioredoxin family protein [Verrucomicrobiaceae bacterium]